MDGSEKSELSGDEIIARTDGIPPHKKRRVANDQHQRAVQIDLDHQDNATSAPLQRLLKALHLKKKILVVAGAGISWHVVSLTNLAVPDFRSKEGLFKTLQAKSKVKGKGEDLFDISVYNNKESMERFHQMITELSDLARDANPTAFHGVLKALAEEGRLMRLYTQNIDCLDTSIQPLATTIPLNMEAPWPVTIQLHGGLNKIQCAKCSHVQDFDKLLFQGPEAPLCKACTENDRIRTEQNGKRSHGIGRLTPRVVLYHGPSPDAEAIGKVSQADLRSVPDIVIVVGTSLTIPGVKKLVRELCQVTRSKKHGLTAWLNVDPPPQETNNLWNFIIRGKCDDFAAKLNLPGRTSDIQVAEEEEDVIIVTSPTDHRIVEGPESHIWKRIQDLKHTWAMKESHMASSSVPCWLSRRYLLTAVERNLTGPLGRSSVTSWSSTATRLYGPCQPSFSRQTSISD
ncbi:DHS-like NAD/FAD-binding domain-containing protein [Diaporthe sp. PMI_573]|nr:DHS-like NAD/FAD-binding domain-containing protein [Diaporthaceae sp. PMI_573]